MENNNEDDDAHAPFRRLGQFGGMRAHHIFLYTCNVMELGLPEGGSICVLISFFFLKYFFYPRHTWAEQLIFSGEGD